MADIKLDHTEIKVKDRKLHVVQTGPEDGKLVILLHGFPEYWRGWKNQIEPLASAGYRVLVPDQVGYNLSDKPLDVSAYTLEETGKDILRLINSVGHKSATLIGHDWGGGVAWWLAAHHPDMIERMAILNMPHPEVMQRMLLRNPGQILKSLYAAFFQIPRVPEAILRNNDWEYLVRTLESSRPGTFSQDDIEHHRRAWWQEGAITGMLNWYRANLRYPPDFPDEKIRVPTLIIWGAQDAALSSEMAQESANMCAEARVVIFKTATHWIQHEEVKEVNALLLEFLP